MTATFLRAFFFIVGSSIAFAKRELVELKAEVNQTTGGKTSIDESCSVIFLRDKCTCSQQNAFSTFYKCRGCQDPNYWGKGCDLQCNEACGDKGCYFDGNCKRDGDEEGSTDNHHCKTSSRAEGSRKDKRNERGECSACERGWYGVNCDKECSSVSPNFVDTDAEGPCTRGGLGYECKKGWFGETCNEQCPDGCDECVLKGGIDPIPGTENSKDGIEFYEAGACKDECNGDFWGPSCDKACPENCKSSSKHTSCSKITGKCYKCGTDKEIGSDKPHQFWGDVCENTCSAGCEDSQCLKGNGHCEYGVLPGFCGLDAQRSCPEGTVKACEIETCKPDACKAGFFPGLDESWVGTCHKCPENCDGDCNQDGTCPACKAGFHGEKCDKTCSEGCANECKQSNGKCASCNPGLTGAYCKDQCHPSCDTCQQEDTWGNPAKANDYCLSCPAIHPSKLETTGGFKAGKCACIENAKEIDGICKCVSQLEGMASFFQKSPKECRVKCKQHYMEVFGNQESTCIARKQYNAVIKACYEPGGSTIVYGSDKCTEGEKNTFITDDYKGERLCMKDVFVKDICTDPTEPTD